MSDLYENGRDIIAKLADDFRQLGKEQLNESDTRFKFIDTILTKCLGWEPNDISTEDVKDGHYADYKLSLFRPVAVWEAKRTGNYFELPVGTSKLIYSLKSFAKDNVEFKKALVQVSEYCHERGIQIGVVSNGWQFVAFLANRNDSVPPLDGSALVVPSLDYFLENYREIWNCLSKRGFAEEYLLKKILGGTEVHLPTKLSSTITHYPGIKNRNPFQSELEILSDLVLEDVIKEKSIEKDFLEFCYCKSGALSQYSVFSKQILSTRYNFLFEENDRKAILEQVTNKRGIAPELMELFANSLSKRPILLIGDVGVGKSTFINNLLVVEAAAVFEKAITFKIDLGSKAIIALDVKRAIIKLIRQQLKDLYAIDIMDDDFVRNAYYINLEEFKKSVHVKRLYDIDPLKAIEKEIDFLSELVSDEAAHIKQSLEYLSKNQQKQVVVFIDNCDQRNDQDQETAFLVAQEFATDWPVIVFVCLRPETFHRTKKIKGALSGYHTKAFTIPPPRIDDVIQKRLSFAQKITSGEIVLSRLSGQTTFSKLHILIQVFKDSLANNKDLYIFLENLSNGNIRKAVELIKKYFGSGHVDTEKILRIQSEQGHYTIPVHELLRSVIFGDNVHYNPNSSEIVNLFEVRSYDSKEHFIVPLILGLLNDYSANNRNQGFILVEEMYAHIQRFGFIPSQIDGALNFMYSKGLFETSQKGNALNSNAEGLLMRATGCGVYHLDFLINSFTYIDAIIVDVPIFDDNTRENIINTLDIIQRLDRATIFASYLDSVWESAKIKDSHFIWPQRSKQIVSEIQSIRNKIESFRQ